MKSRGAKRLSHRIEIKNSRNHRSLQTRPDRSKPMSEALPELTRSQEGHEAADVSPQPGVTRRRFLRDGVIVTGAALTGGAVLFDASPALAADTRKRIYIAADDHTDYMWTGSEETYRQAFLAMTDYWLNRADATATNPADFQSRWNCDGSFWMWTYERNKSRADFEGRFIARLRDGHLSIPLTTLVGIYGGTPAEAILRGLYYAGRIERRYNLRFPLAVAMENQTLPFGLGSLWAGAGAKYSWRGICGCGTSVPTAGNRDHEIYWWTGQDGSRILMKWHSLYARPAIDFNSASYKSRYSGYTEPYGNYLDANQNIGGYAEARYPYEVVDFVDTNSAFLAKYPYRVIGAFGQGWDDGQTLADTFVPAAQNKTNTTRRVIVSNEADFFQDFETTYGAALPTESVTYGNEWEIAIAGLQEVSAVVRRAVEETADGGSARYACQPEKSRLPHQPNGQRPHHARSRFVSARNHRDYRPDRSPRPRLHQSRPVLRA